MVEGHPDRRRFGRGLAVGRIALGEGAGAGGLPDGLGEDAVDRDGPGGRHGGYRPDASADRRDDALTWPGTAGGDRKRGEHRPKGQAGKESEKARVASWILC